MTGEPAGGGKREGKRGTAIEREGQGERERQREHVGGAKRKEELRRGREKRE